jgi:hypothetical protein
MTIQANFPAIKPSLLLDFANTKQLDSRITYTRASTASFYNGVSTAKAEENLVLYSQSLNTAPWATTGVTVGTGITAPDGTSTAQSLTSTTSDGYIEQAIGIVLTNTYTVSVYLKAASATTIGIGFGNQSSTVSVTTSWQRFVFTGTFSSGGGRIIIGGFSTFPSSAPVVNVWGAQLEQRSAVTAYTATTTQAITNYIPALQSAASGVARFDNNPTTGESLGLLIEESRTNLFTYSEQFDNAAWTKQESTITANTIVSPDGALDGEKLDETTANDVHRLEHNLTTVNGTVYTLSVFAKAAERQWLFLFEDSATNACTFNLSTGTVGTTQGSVTASISSVGNGWYRCSLTYTQSGTTGRMRIAVANGTSTTSYTGVANNGIFIWGAQTEAGAFASSYIPTVASQVTRAADAASMTGTNFSTWYNAGEGTVYVESLLNGNSSSLNHRLLWISDNTTTNYIAFDETATTNYRFVSNTNGVSQVSINVTVTDTGLTNKLIGAYKVNDFAATANAVTVGTDTSGTLPVVNRVEFGSGASASYINGTIKKIAYYPLRVTNAQLQALTS